MCLRVPRYGKDVIEDLFQGRIEIKQERFKNAEDDIIESYKIETE
jgi:hypothetical protein